MEGYFDLAVIGAGPAGYNAALRAARLGMRVVVADKRELGGTCINSGCIPAKALLHAAGLYASAKQGASFGLRLAGVGFDYGAIARYRDEAVRAFRDEIAQEFKDLGITLVRGAAKIVGPHSVAIDSQTTYTAKNILIATGAAPQLPFAEGIEDAGVITSEDVLCGNSWLYDSLVIIGGGVVGVELATAFASLGARVTIVERTQKLLCPMDEEISDALCSLLKQKGIDVYTGAELLSVRRTREGVTCEFTAGGESRTVTAQSALSAIGRKPYSANLIHPCVPIKTENCRVITDDDFSTSVRGVYAVGDVTERVQSAHLASAQGIYVVERLAKVEPTVVLSAVPKFAYVKLPIIPAGIYVEPEIATVGITEAEAEAHGIKTVCGRCDMGRNGRAVISKEAGGFVKLVFEAFGMTLIGAQIMCSRATDMIAEAATAVANEMSAHTLLMAMRAHPTYSEGVAEAVKDALLVRSRMA